MRAGSYTTGTGGRIALPGASTRRPGIRQCLRYSLIGMLYRFRVGGFWFQGVGSSRVACLDDTDDTHDVSREDVSLRPELFQVKHQLYLPQTLHSASADTPASLISSLVLFRQSAVNSRLYFTFLLCD